MVGAEAEATGTESCEGHIFPGEGDCVVTGQMCGCRWALPSGTPGSLSVLGLTAKTLIFSPSQLPWRPG